jgi:hypothetical protein
MKLIVLLNAILKIVTKTRNIISNIFGHSYSSLFHELKCTCSMICELKSPENSNLDNHSTNGSALGIDQGRLFAPCGTTQRLRRSLVHRREQ